MEHQAPILSAFEACLDFIIALGFDCCTLKLAFNELLRVHKTLSRYELVCDKNFTIILVLEVDDFDLIIDCDLKPITEVSKRLLIH